MTDEEKKRLDDLLKDVDAIPDIPDSAALVSNLFIELKKVS